MSLRLALRRSWCGRFSSIIKNLRRAGRTILLVEQMANLALRVADRAYILEQGKVVLEGTGPRSCCTILMSHGAISAAQEPARRQREP